MPQAMLKGDRTLYNQRTKKYLEFVGEYELIKKKLHPDFSQEQLWTKARKIDKRNFLKYYNRYKQSDGDVTSMLPANGAQGTRQEEQILRLKSRLVS
jgi:hypothetical protein